MLSYRFYVKYVEALHQRQQFKDEFQHEVASNNLRNKIATIEICLSSIDSILSQRTKRITLSGGLSVVGLWIHAFEFSPSLLKGIATLTSVSTLAYALTTWDNQHADKVKVLSSAARKTLFNLVGELQITGITPQSNLRKVKNVLEMKKRELEEEVDLNNAKTSRNQDLFIFRR
ncbi:MAG: hypothetical protein A3F12_04415 [Gammaproteobacteria bacterium RIFCSPHIGHO2_12_FULL_38_14]|nr:MAG: hypothetical protein A3F12_04415 [Gammaproteobacteria bacterium RIFCSPHIGHO2_12_FULL_38_14]